MSSLYRRASPGQIRLLRIVSGAVRNARDAHPDWPFDDRFETSIAKRAAGTLSAQLADVLATVHRSSYSPDPESEQDPANRKVDPQTYRRRASRALRRAPSPAEVLNRVNRKIGLLIENARRAGNGAACDALIDAARVVSKELGK